MKAAAFGRRPHFAYLVHVLAIFGPFQSRSDFHAFLHFLAILERANRDFLGTALGAALRYHKPKHPSSDLEHAWVRIAPVSRTAEEVTYSTLRCAPRRSTLLAKSLFKASRMRLYLSRTL